MLKKIWIHKWRKYNHNSNLPFLNSFSFNFKLNLWRISVLCYSVQCYFQSKSLIWFPFHWTVYLVRQCLKGKVSIYASPFFCHNVNARILGCKVCVKSEKMQYWNEFGEFFGITSRSKWGNLIYPPCMYQYGTCLNLSLIY